jgi:1-acyl-sn-glycerol-3-phosphate acyltransferase
MYFRRAGFAVESVGGRKRAAARRFIRDSNYAPNSLRCRLNHMIRSILVYAFVGLYILLLAPPAMLWRLFSGDCSLVYRLARFCIRTAGWACGVRVQAHGLEKITPGKTFVFLSNHQGNFDGPVLLHTIPLDWKALIKSEMMRLPVLSLVLRKLQFVPIERLNAKNAHAGIELGARLLQEGNSFVAFPEGTRSRDGRLGEFKKGVFIMAIKAQIPIIPITILDSAAILPPGKFTIRPGRIRVIIHDPIVTEGMRFEDRNQLVSMTRDAIASGLPPNLRIEKPISQNPSTRTPGS